MEMYLDKYLPTAAQAKKASLAVDRKGVDEHTFAKLAAITRRRAAGTRRTKDFRK